MESFDPKTIYIILHLFGVALGAGGAFMSDLMYLFSMRDKRLELTEFRFLQLGSRMVWGGLAVLLISGFLLYSLEPARYLASDKFLLKMTIVGVLIVNGLVFHVWHLPTLTRSLGKDLRSDSYFRKKSVGLYISGAVSIVSWSLAIILGALRGIPLGYLEGLLVYGGLLLFAISGALVSRKFFFRPSRKSN